MQRAARPGARAGWYGCARHAGGGGTLTEIAPERRLVLRTLAGMLLMLASTGFLAGMHAAIRLVPGGMHPFQIAFFRNVMATVYLVPVQAAHGFATLRTERIGMHFLRAVFNLVSMLAFFKGVLITPLADVAALNFLAPLLASGLALTVLREPVRLHRVAGIVFGFAGALVILRPGEMGFSGGGWLIVFSASIWSGGLIVIKLLARTDSSATITFYAFLLMTPLSLFPALAVWQPPTLAQIGAVALLAAFGTAGHFSLAQAFRLADAAAVLPLDFMRLVWSAALGYLMFAESPDLWTWVGGAMIFSSTTYLTYREVR